MDKGKRNPNREFSTFNLPTSQVIEVQVRLVLDSMSGALGLETLSRSVTIAKN